MFHRVGLSLRGMGSGPPTPHSRLPITLHFLSDFSYENPDRISVPHFCCAVIQCGRGVLLYLLCPEDRNQRFHNCFGSIAFADGNKYVGEFKDDKYHGQGTYTSANGIVKEGVWENGAFQYARKDPNVDKAVRKKFEKRQALKREAKRRKVEREKAAKREVDALQREVDEEIKRDEERRRYLKRKEDEQQRKQILEAKLREEQRRAIERAEARRLEAERPRLIEEAMVRCEYEHIDEITSDATERIIKKKCRHELRKLTTEDLQGAYRPLWQKVKDAVKETTGIHID